VKKFGLVITLIAVSGCVWNAKADATPLASSTATTNSSSSATQVISPNPAWAGPLAGSSWISNANTGDPSAPGFIVVPNGTAVTFTQTFNLSGTITGANLDVLADAGLITRAKSGRTVTVRLRPQPMREAMAWLSRYERFWTGGLDRLAAYAERKETELRSKGA